MNKITFAGRLAADAELRHTPNGDPVCSFRVASDVGYGDRKSTNWFSCQIWGKRGQALQEHLSKGSQVTVFGTLTLREWEGRDGAKQLSPDVRVDEIVLQGGKRDGQMQERPAPQQREQPQQQEQYTGNSFDDFEDSIPF